MLNFDLAETRAGKDIYQMGVLKKSREAVIENLEARFEVAPRSITDIINGLDDLSILKMLHKKAATVESLDEFRRVMDKALS